MISTLISKPAIDDSAGTALHLMEIRMAALLIEHVQGFRLGSLVCLAKLVEQGDLSYANAVMVLSQHLERIDEGSEFKGLTS